MEKLHCIRGFDRDWKVKGNRHQHPMWVLCDDISREWWELDDAEEIYLSASMEPLNSASYKCELRNASNRMFSDQFRIFAEDTEEWFEHAIYSRMQRLLEENKGPRGIVYLTVEVIK